MRPSRILAIARRDLRMEFAGRRGAALPLIASALLFPLAASPPLADLQELAPPIRVTGSPPPAVVALDDVVAVAVDDDPDVGFSAQPDGLHVYGRRIDRRVRDALSTLEPGLETRVIEGTPLPVPQRSLLLALLSASILTGGIGQSIPGERTSRTLETLLTTSVSRAEIVAGKCLAWASFGGGFALLATLATLFLGRQPPGWWVLPVPLVSLGTVALGFWLVRRANDVIGGTTVAIRVLPAALTILGLAAWWIGLSSPLLGAAVPLGGALVAAGAIWPGPAPALVSTASTLALVAVALQGAARDLDAGERAQDDRGLLAALTTTGMAWAGWWAAILGALVWTIAGAPERTALFTTAQGWSGGAAVLGLLVLVKWGRALDPSRALGTHRSSAAAWPLAVLAGPVFALALALPDAPVTLAEQAAARLHAPFASGTALDLSTATAFLAAAVAQELLFRGWLRRQIGSVGATVAATLVLFPLAPLQGLAANGLLAALVERSGGSVWPAVLARALALPCALLLTPAGGLPVDTLGIVATGVGLLATASLLGGRRRGAV